MRSRTHRFFGSGDGERQAALRALTSRGGGVLLTTYGMVLHNADALARGLGRISDGATAAPALLVASSMQCLRVALRPWGAAAGRLRCRGGPDIRGGQAAVARVLQQPGWCRAGLRAPDAGLVAFTGSRPLTGSER
jgi:hypothetical protein